MGLKDFFWVSDNTQHTEKQPTPTPVTKPIITHTDTFKSSTIEAGKIDDSISKNLQQALDTASKNKPPYNYLQFSKAVNEQLIMIPDELTRYKAAIATASTMGVTPQSLIGDVTYYIGILKEEAANFETTMANVIKNAVTAKEQDIKKLDDDTQAKAEQIKKLTEEINDLQQQKSKLHDEIAQRKIEIDKTQNNFETTLKVFVSKINTDLEKIKKYLLTSGGQNA
jgi:chromosome segregation ATPase